MTHRNLADGALTWAIPIVTVIAFSGIVVFFEFSDSYDFFRKAEIIYLSLLALYFIFRSPTADDRSPSRILQVCAMVFTLLAICLNASDWSPFSIADAALYGILFLGAASCARLLELVPRRQAESAEILALAPLLSVWLMAFSIVGLFTTGTWNDWQLAFSTIREFDDALLPCLFLLWHRPNRLARSRMTPVVWVLSTLYLLALWQDGARSALLAAISGLLLIAILRKDLAMLRLPLSTFAVAAAIFYSMRWVLDSSHTTHTVFRLSSSYRSALWGGLGDAWLQSPWVGIGGAQFGQRESHPIALHPHNIALQWIGEYGILGLGIVFAVGLFLYRMIRMHHSIPPFCLGGLIACVINSLFSGAFVYPLSQLLTIWMAGWALASYYKCTASSKIPVVTSLGIFRSRLPIVLTSTALLVAMWAVHGRDLLSWQSSTDLNKVSPPRFWQRGAVLHLVAEREDATSFGKTGSKWQLPFLPL